MQSGDTQGWIERNGYWDSLTAGDNRGCAWIASAVGACAAELFVLVVSKDTIARGSQVPLVLQGFAAKVRASCRTSTAPACRRPAFPARQEAVNHCMSWSSAPHRRPGRPLGPRPRYSWMSSRRPKSDVKLPVDNRNPCVTFAPCVQEPRGVFADRRGGYLPTGI